MAAVEVNDAEGIVAFTSIQAHKGFTKAQAFRAFAGVKFGNR